MSITALLEQFEDAAGLMADHKQAHRMAGTVRRFLWSEHISHPSQVVAAAIASYLAGLAGRGRSRKTLINHRASLSSFCRFLCGRGMLESNPCGEIRLGRVEEKLPRYLDEAEIEIVLRTADNHGIWPEVCLALSTGLRLSEMIRLWWADLDLGRRCLTVRKSKSRRPRVVPLGQCALEAVAAQCRRTGDFQYVFPARRTWPGGWRYVDKQRAASWWIRALRPIQEAVPKFRGLPGKCTGRGWHLFRHTFASRAAQAGVSLYKLAAWLGHSDVRTTQIYAHLQAGFDEEIERAAPLPMRVDE